MRDGRCLEKTVMNALSLGMVGIEEGKMKTFAMKPGLYLTIAGLGNKKGAPSKRGCSLILS